MGIGGLMICSVIAICIVSAFAWLLPEHVGIGAALGGFVSAIGGSLAALFSISLVSKHRFKKHPDAGKWKTEKTYPTTIQSLIVFGLSIVVMPALFVVPLFVWIVAGAAAYFSAFQGFALLIPTIGLVIPTASWAICAAMAQSAEEIAETDY